MPKQEQVLPETQVLYRQNFYLEAPPSVPQTAVERLADQVERTLRNVGIYISPLDTSFEFFSNMPPVGVRIYEANHDGASNFRFRLDQEWDILHIMFSPGEQPDVTTIPVTAGATAGVAILIANRYMVLQGEAPFSTKEAKNSFISAAESLCIRFDREMQKSQKRRERKSGRKKTRRK